MTGLEYNIMQVTEYSVITHVKTIWRASYSNGQQGLAALNYSMRVIQPRGSSD